MSMWIQVRVRSAPPRSSASLQSIALYYGHSSGRHSFLLRKRLCRSGLHDIGKGFALVEHGCDV
jgi:hypothetical protein